jgi:hypothetical protein
LTRGRAATPDPIDIGAVSRSGEVFEALAARRPKDPGDDPAVRLLAALVADVDVGAPPLPAPARVCAKTGSRRRVVRAVVTLGVTAAVLTTAGAAAAGGGGDGGKDAAGAHAPRVDLTERTAGSLQVSVPERSAGRRFVLPGARSDEKRRGEETHPARSSRSGTTQKQRKHDDHDMDLSGATPLQESDGDGREKQVAPSPEPTGDSAISLPDIQP